MAATRQRDNALGVERALLARRRMPAWPQCVCWAFCASFQRIAQLACTCQHTPGSHQSIAGVQVDGQYLSALTAEYPPSLAKSLAKLTLPFVSQQGHYSASISDFTDFITEDFVPCRLKLCDGAGLNSTADHSTPKLGGLQSLAQTFMDWFRSRDMIRPTLQHLASGTDSHPLSKDQQLELAKICHNHLLPSVSADTALHISPGQPFRLRLLQAMAEHIKDPDSALPALLEQGVRNF